MEFSELGNEAERESANGQGESGNYGERVVHSDHIARG